MIARATISALLVDDEQLAREELSYLLKEFADIEVLASAKNGLEAIKLIEQLEPDVVFLDVHMPGLDGLELIRQLHAAQPRLPIILITAFGTTETAIEATKLGAYDYLLKPFERDQLLATVSRALENRRLKLENRTYQSNLESLVEARTDQLQAAMSSLERSYDITLEALGDALDLKDAETEGHSRRVTAFTIAIAKAMGLPHEQIPIIARGAFLHDIGKMAIPDAILRKPGKLDADEVTTMQEHCYKGYQIVKKIPFLAEACEIIYSHQERYDGSGYPRGLKGKEIPLGARIFSIADTLDAIMSDRPYRPKQPFHAAKAEIEKWSGRQFDPEVVKVFLEMPEKIWDDLRKDIDGQISRITYSAGARG